MSLSNFENAYKLNRESQLFGRYITAQNIDNLVCELLSDFLVTTVGKSVLKQNIYSIQFGHGPQRILMWSQMHGNESTTTKAVFDFINSCKTPNATFKSLLEACTICVIPMLNPDGANVYTRHNANTVDLNRDAQDLSQPESKVLRDVFNTFKPHYCFNLHGQRTMYSVGDSPFPATLSFLAPSEDTDRTVTPTRERAMAIIGSMTDSLQAVLKHRIGRYDDGFNSNCVGDKFTSLGVPTVLFEAGHHAHDYNREQTRFYVYLALCFAIECVANVKADSKYDTTPYFAIPENGKMFCDILLKGAMVEGKLCDIAFQYQERLIHDEIHFIPQVIAIENLYSGLAHKTIEASENKVCTHNKKPISIGYENDFVLINNRKFLL